MSKMVTRCPQCKTSFRVTDEHLKIAHGAVRCGSCLNVFQAQDHWVPETSPPTSTVGATAAPIPAQVTTERPASRFSVPIPTPSFLQAADKKAAMEKPPAPPAGKFQFDQAAIDAQPKGKFQFDQSAIDSGSAAKLLGEPEKRIQEPVPVKAPAKAVTDIGDDDKISDDIELEGDEEDSSTQAFGTDNDDYSSLFEDGDIANADSDDFEALLSGDFSDLDSIGSQTTLDDETDDADEEWAKGLLDELEDDASPDLHSHQQDSTSLVDYSNPTDVDEALRDLGFDKLPPSAPGKTERPLASSAHSAKTDKTSEESHPHHQTSREAMLAHIEPAPVEIHRVIEQPAFNWRVIAGEVSICTFLVLTLLGQYLFFNFTRLSKQASTRPLMQTVCMVFPCELPASEEWRSIKISNLVVRQHPTVTDGLIVDAIIYNHASHELPFPKLELYFNDMEQLPVASRRYEPSEYLAGELSGKTLMPPARPIHIAFEIMNPGEKAVNWRLDVTPFP